MFRPGAGQIRGSFSSRRSRHSANHNQQESIYEASEVHDSAEDLREIIERQDRDSERVENVRACCDGKLPLCGLLDYPTSSVLLTRHVH